MPMPCPVIDRASSEASWSPVPAILLVSEM